MSSNYEAKPGIVTNGLILNLDAGDPDSYTRSQPPYVEVLVVAGGGSGGGSTAGGGGAGGLVYNSAYQLNSAAPITVTIGAGGSGVGPTTVGNDGNNSVFGSITATGGGGGGMTNGAPGGAIGRNGGSGGGGAHYSSMNFGTPGTGISGQGTDGGNGSTGDQDNFPGGGGGGASTAGGNATVSKSGNGGSGLTFSISGTPTTYAGGGGGGSSLNGGDGGTGGGGAGTSNGYGGTAGTANTGGGGGGGWYYCCGAGGAGGSGIVIVRYPGFPAATGGTITYANGYTTHVFTSSDTFTPNKWNDLTGNNNSGSLVNGVGFNSYQNGGYFTFDGTDDVIDVIGNFGTYSNYTICYWAMRDAESRMPVAGRLNTNFYWFGDNSWAYTHGGVWGEYYYSKNVSIPLGSWGHLCVVYNGSNVSIYRQGIYQGQQSTTGTADWSQGLKIGYWAGGSGYAWLGRIPVVQFYNRALSAAEIAQNYNAGKDRFGL
jgi:hypothetical protein